MSFEPRDDLGDVEPGDFLMVRLDGARQIKKVATVDRRAGTVTLIDGTVVGPEQVLFRTIPGTPPDQMR